MFGEDLAPGAFQLWDQGGGLESGDGGLESGGCLTLWGVLSSEKAFGGISPTGTRRRHTWLFCIDPSDSAAPMGAFDLSSSSKSN